MTALRGLLVTAAVLLVTGCGDDQGHEVHTDTASTIAVSSPAFGQGEEIPQRFTCDGDAVSPPLAWSGGQAGAWAVVVDDPDAPGGTYVHWVVVDIPQRISRVEAGAVPSGGVQVVNASNEAAYAGPCPPSGEHRYRFTVYALDTPTGLTESASLDDALEAIGEHATSRGTMTAVYSRP